MRLSDLLSRSGNRGAVPESGREDAEANAAPAGNIPPLQGQLKPEEFHSPVQAGKSHYNNLSPGSILGSAAQLEIPVPQNSRLVLRRAQESLLKIIQAAIRPAEKKDSLWEATLKIVYDLSQLIALDSDLCYAVEYDVGEKEWLAPHSVATCLIAMDMAKRVDNIECSIEEIGAAGLLHDIGMARLGLDSINDHVVKSPEHVDKGLESLEEMKVPELVRTIIAQHHERTNGKGYPKGLSGQNILVCSQVMALSETFERFMSRSFQESDRKGVSPLNYVQATLDEFHGAMDPKILKIFISLKGFYPRGVMVELTNRSICLVLKPNEGYPLQPIVQMVVNSTGNHHDTPSILDLRHSALSILRALINEEDQR